MSSPDPFQLVARPAVLSPGDMLALPRPGPPQPNPAGDLALVAVTEWSFDDRDTRRSLAVVPLLGPPGDPHPIPLPNGGTAFWLDTRTIAHVVAKDLDDTGTPNADAKTQSLYALPLEYSSGSFSTGPPVLVGSFPVSTAADFRYAHQAGVLVFSADVYPDGDLLAVPEHDKAWENRGNTAFVYDRTFERHWDSWLGPKHKSLFTVKLSKAHDHAPYQLGNEFVNVLKGTNLSSPVEPFGGTDDFDISARQIVFTAKDLVLPKAWHTKQNIYLVDFDGSNLVELTSGDHGATHAPAFNPQGTKLAWLQLDQDGHESDRHKVVVHDIAKGLSLTVTQDWDRSPSAIAWSESGDVLYLTVQDIARVKIFALPVAQTQVCATRPVPLTHSKSAGGVIVLAGGDRLCFGLSSLTHPMDVHVLDGLARFEAELVQGGVRQQNQEVQHHGTLVRLTVFGASTLGGKMLSEGEDFWFDGATQRVHGWIVTPPGFDPADVKRWPVMFVIHGGPESCWTDEWSNRWNLNVFAHQGYFVVAINPTGSTSFGQDLTEGIKEDWGGKPFVDLRRGWQYVLDHYPQIDPERAVAAGASWGGYAINWIQGNPELGFGFKALFCHDGVFDASYNGFSTDELFFFNHEWGGRPWEPRAAEIIRKYSPANTVSKWSTPQLIVHGSKDFRLPETEGISAFHALQQLGVRSRLVIFPDENHWVLNPGNSLKWHHEVFKWFDEFVGDKAKKET